MPVRQGRWAGPCPFGATVQELGHCRPPCAALAAFRLSERAFLPGSATLSLPDSPRNVPGPPGRWNVCEEVVMTGTDPARGATARSGPRLALIVIGIVVLL